jgi:hypothetical protein
MELDSLSRYVRSGIERRSCTAYSPYKDPTPNSAGFNGSLRGSHLVLTTDDAAGAGPS